MGPRVHDNLTDLCMMLALSLAAVIRVRSLRIFKSGKWERGLRKCSGQLQMHGCSILIFAVGLLNYVSCSNLISGSLTESDIRLDANQANNMLSGWKSGIWLYAHYADYLNSFLSLRMTPATEFN